MDLDVLQVSFKNYDYTNSVCSKNSFKRLLTAFPKQYVYFEECVCFIIFSYPDKIRKSKGRMSFDVNSNSHIKASDNCILYGESPTCYTILRHTPEFSKLFCHIMGIIEDARRRGKITQIEFSDIKNRICSNKNNSPALTRKRSLSNKHIHHKSYAVSKEVSVRQIWKKTKRPTLLGTYDVVLKVTTLPTHYMFENVEHDTCESLSSPVQEDSGSRVLLSSGTSVKSLPRHHSNIRNDANNNCPNSAVSNNVSSNQTAQRDRMATSSGAPENIVHMQMPYVQRNGIGQPSETNLSRHSTSNGQYNTQLSSQFEKVSIRYANNVPCPTEDTDDIRRRSEIQRNQLRPSRPPRYPEYRDRNNRERTFRRWPRKLPSSTTINDAGFFYTNQFDLVRCYQCGIGLKDFCNTDNPLEEHVKNSEDCEFLQQLFTSRELENFKRRLRERDPNVFRQEQQQQLDRSRGQTGEDYHIPLCRHPEYRTYESRLSSFCKWPPHITQRPEQLAEAGLYYTGLDDHVRCFSCDGGLRRWDPEDDPWMEHCRWFPACPFARDSKGDEYIALVQASVDVEANTESGQQPTTGYDIGEVSRLDLIPENTTMYRELKEHRIKCTDEMGFTNELFNAAILELKRQGNPSARIEDIIMAVDVIEERRKQAEELNACSNRIQTTETLIEDNRRLKQMVQCLQCTHVVNCLFLPCTHHRLCIDCSQPIQTCPICDRPIREKIKTFMS